MLAVTSCYASHCQIRRLICIVQILSDVPRGDEDKDGMRRDGDSKPGEEEGREFDISLGYGRRRKIYLSSIWFYLHVGCPFLFTKLSVKNKNK